MTSEALLIVGYKIDAHTYNDIEVLQQTIENYLKTKSNNTFKYRDYDDFKINDKPVLFFVHRAYDSVDMDDYGIYLAFNYLDLCTNGEVIQSEKLITLASMQPQIVDTNINEVLEAVNLKTIGGFEIFSDCYDCDRTFDIYVI